MNEAVEIFGQIKFSQPGWVEGSDVQGGALVIEDGPECPSHNRSTGEVAVSVDHRDDFQVETEGGMRVMSNARH